MLDSSPDNATLQLSTDQVTSISSEDSIITDRVVWGEITTTETISKDFSILFGADTVPGTYDFKIVLTLYDLVHEIQSQ